MGRAGGKREHVLAIGYSHAAQVGVFFQYRRVGKLRKQVSDALVELLRRVEVRPRYLIAKGGITSSDLATRGLGVKRAMVLGQILPGVPIWALGAETRYPGLAYVVFPGNVGGPDALAEAVNKFNE